MADIDKIFRDLISLVGKEIELGLRSSGEKMTGRVCYTMFDSFLLEVKGVKRVIPFADILFLDPV